MEATRLMEAVEMVPVVLGLGVLAVALGLAALAYRARTR